VGGFGGRWVRLPEAGEDTSMVLTTFNVITFILLVLTGWVVWARFTRGLETSWPLIYYMGVVVYSKVFPGSLDAVWVYAGVIAALFLRFEFMGGVILKLIRLADLIVLGYILWRSVALLMMW